MTAQEYFNQAYKLDQRINSKIEQLAKLNDLAHKATATYTGMPHSPNKGYILDCSVIIVDDVMYANIMPEDLPLFYRAVSFLNEERSLIIITNRELSGWINAAEDTHLMQTLVDRIKANSQIIRL